MRSREVGGGKQKREDTVSHIENPKSLPQIWSSTNVDTWNWNVQMICRKNGENCHLQFIGAFQMISFVESKKGTYQANTVMLRNNKTVK